MKQSNPYAPMNIDEPPPCFVPDPVDLQVLEDEVKQVFDQHRNTLLMIGAAFYLFILVEVLLYFLAPIYIVLLLLPVYPVLSFFASIFTFELVKNGQCSQSQFFRHARTAFLFRFASIWYSLPRIVLSLGICIPALYLWLQYMDLKDDNMFLWLPILGAFLGVEMQSVSGGFFVMDVNDSFQDAVRNGRILLKSKTRGRVYFYNLLQGLWSVFIFYVTLTLGLIYLIPYQYVRHAVYYLAATQSHRKNRTEIPDY